MITDKHTIGQLGEELTAEYLRKQGYIIVKKNYRDRFGEIDIIAENHTTLVFVEVKTRTQGALVSGMEAIDYHKQKRIKTTAISFAKRLKLPLNLRFDVCEVTLIPKENGLVEPKLHYIPEAF